MEHTPVSSSNIASVGYDEEDKALEVRFTTGALYRYGAVPRAVYTELMQAESKGVCFSRHIRDIYPATRLQPADKPADKPAKK